MKKSDEKAIKWYEVVFVMIVGILLIAIGINTFGKKVDYHCEKAVCNSDNTICSTYVTNDEGETVKTWQGSCIKR